MAGSHFLHHPVQIGFVAGERLDEVGAWHVRPIHTDGQDFTLMLTHDRNLFTHGIGQLLHHFGSKANAHEFVQNGFLSLHIARALVAFGLKRDAHLVKPLADDVELLERLVAQIFNLLAAHAAGWTFVLVVGSDTGAGVLFAIIIHQTVNHFVDLHDAFTYTLNVGQNFVNGGRTSGNSHHHVLQAVFDTLGDFNLALARQQLHRPHLAHVHAHRVCGATEVGIHGG
jgi:hypothetical protein